MVKCWSLFLANLHCIGARARLEESRGVRKEHSDKFHQRRPRYQLFDIFEGSATRKRFRRFFLEVANPHKQKVKGIR